MVPGLGEAVPRAGSHAPAERANESLAQIVLVIGLLYVVARLFGDDSVLRLLDVMESRAVTAWQRLREFTGCADRLCAGVALPVVFSGLIPGSGLGGRINQ